MDVQGIALAYRRDGRQGAAKNGVPLIIVNVKDSRKISANGFV